MSEQSVYPVPADWAKRAKVDRAGYEKLYGRSLADPGTFWLEQARRLDWIKRPEMAGDWSFGQDDFRISWFADGVLNASANCLDRHLATRGDTVALIWEPDDPTEQPRRIRRYAATGESMPPDSRHATRPLVPVGRPPAPGTLPKK